MIIEGDFRDEDTQTNIFDNTANRYFCQRDSYSIAHEQILKSYVLLW